MEMDPLFTLNLQRASLVVVLPKIINVSKGDASIVIWADGSTENSYYYGTDIGQRDKDFNALLAALKEWYSRRLFNA